MRVYDSFIQQFHRSRNNLIEYLSDTYRSLDRKIFSKKNLWKDVDSGQMESVQRERERERKKWTCIGMFCTVSRTAPRPPWNNLLRRSKLGEAARREWCRRYNTWLTVLFEVSSNYEMDGRRERERERERKAERERKLEGDLIRWARLARPPPPPPSPPPFAQRSGLDRPGGWLSCTSLVRVPYRWRWGGEGYVAGRADVH